MTRRPQRAIADQFEHFVSNVTKPLSDGYARYAEEGARESAFPAIVQAWRGNRPIVGMTVEPVAFTERIEAILQVLARGMEADSIALAMDTLQSVGNPINPDTGQMWGPGEMGQYVDQHPDALLKGTLTEALTMLMMTRTGDSWTSIRPYVRMPKTLYWLDAIETSEKIGPDKGHDLTRTSGRIPDLAKAAFRASLIGPPPEHPEMTRAELDVAYTEALSEIVGPQSVVHLQAATDEHRQVIGRRMYGDMLAEN